MSSLCRGVILSCGRVVMLSCCSADLSFNNITVIEGLETLTKLADLTLFHNKISEIKGLDSLKGSLEVCLPADRLRCSARLCVDVMSSRLLCAVSVAGFKPPHQRLGTRVLPHVREAQGSEHAGCVARAFRRYARCNGRR